MPLSPLLVLQARAEARATLYREHAMELGEALVPLRAYALANNIDDDTAMKIINAAFGLTEGGDE